MHKQNWLKKKYFSDHSARKTLTTVVQTEQQKACERMLEKQSEGDSKSTSKIVFVLSSLYESYIVSTQHGINQLAIPTECYV